MTFDEIAALDDDKKLKRRYINKRVNAAKENIGFHLTFEDYAHLVKEAGLVSSQLGFTGEGYVLARYDDTGDYEVSNCRFITQKENADEKKASIAARNASFNNIQKYNISCGKNIHTTQLSELPKNHVCIDCGVPISFNSLRCRTCENEYRKQKPARISKEKLEQLITEKSAVQIAKEYGISDRMVGKWLKKYGLQNPRTR